MIYLTAFLFVFSLLLSSTLSIGRASADDGLRPLITTSELLVGRNRFGFGLMSGSKFVNRAAVALRIYEIEASGSPRLESEVDALYQPIRTQAASGSVHRHPDGTSHVHSADNGIEGMYVAQLNFPRAGTWGIEMAARQSGAAPKKVRLSVVVANKSSTPVVGSPAPRSRNLIAADVPELRQIDTSPRPDSRLHQVRIADAIAQQKPQLIVFATPQFCTSRMCGPVVDIVRALLPSFGKRVAFIHQEIWEDFAEKKVFPTVAEWRLQSEPWIFVVDAQGTISARFEGLVTESELHEALQKLLQ